MAIEKIKILGVVLEQPAPRILIFLIAMGAKTSI